MLKIAFKFLLPFSALTILSALLWQQFITNTLYHCTDSVGIDYFLPGHWVHNPVSVTQVVPAASMSEPDIIKSGWSQIRLLALWFTLVCTSILTSILLARRPWFSIHPLTSCKSC